MADNINTKTFSSNEGGVPSAIIDKGGRIIAFNSEFKSLIPKSAAQSNFFELFDGDRLLAFQKIFMDSRKSDAISKDIIELANEFGNSTTFEVIISPMRSENNTYYIINFQTSVAGLNSTETQRYWIASSELEKIAHDKTITTLVNKIKMTFPFTFIEKAKIQKMINEYDGYFWIKDILNKYLLVNNKYALSLGFKPSQIENKNEEEFLPKYLTNLYKMLSSYIIDSTNSVIIDSKTSPITSGIDRNSSVVQFPLCDLDNNVVAIIGFTQQNYSKTEVTGESAHNPILREIPQSIMVFDKEYKVSDYSNEFAKYLNIDPRTDLVGQEISKIFEAKFLPQIEEYLKDEEKLEEIKFNYFFIEKAQRNSVVSMKKLFSEKGEYFGTQVCLVEETQNNSEIESKAKMYDAIIQHAPEAIFIYDIENLKFLEVNDEALKLYGYKKHDFLNMDLTDLYAPEDIQTIIESGETKSAPGSYSGPWRHKKSDGSSVLVELNRSSIDFKSKKSHLNIVRNVSDQADLKKRLQILETINEHSGDPVIYTDKDGFITEINEKVTKRLGYSKKDLETRPFITLVSDDDRAKVNKNIFHSGLLKTISLDVNFKKPAGNFYNATVIGTPIKNFTGDIESFCVIVKLMEETANGKDVGHPHGEKIPRVDPPFLSNIFHEILTPINVILGFTQELGESIPVPNEDQKEAIEIIKENQKLLLQIMDNAVEYSTLEQKVIRFKPEEFNFVEILEELKENTRKTAEDKKVEMVYGKISSSLAIETDKQKFTSLLSLFVKFAIQITKENSIYLSASLFDENHCSVRIKDTRNLISPYLLKALTEIMSEDENMSRRNYGFSRFSVKLSKKLIELLSVRKEVIMKEGEPQEFALVIPVKFELSDKENMELEQTGIVKKPDSKPKPKVMPRKAEEVSFTETLKPVVSKALDLTQLSCLYLEDQVDSQMLFKVQLKDLKSIEFAPSFESALPLLKTKKFDFIVMDINLQGEYNGLDALRIIQKMPAFKDIPIIASTAYVQPGARDNFIAAGFSDFVSKPLLREKLLEVLRVLFQ